MAEADTEAAGADLGECGLAVTSESTHSSAHAAFRQCGFLTSSVPVVAERFLAAAHSHLSHTFSGKNNLVPSLVKQEQLLPVPAGSGRRDYFPALDYPFDETMFTALLPSFWERLHGIFGDGCCELAQVSILTTAASNQHQSFHDDLIPSARRPDEQLYFMIDLNDYHSGALEVLGGCFMYGAWDDAKAPGAAETERKRRCGSRCYEFLQTDKQLLSLLRTPDDLSLPEREEVQRLFAKLRVDERRCGKETGWYREGRAGHWVVYTPATLHRGRQLLSELDEHRFVLMLDIARIGSDYKRFVDMQRHSSTPRLQAMMEQRRAWFAQERERWLATTKKHGGGGGSEL